MQSWLLLSKPLECPIPALAVIFTTWKILLLVVAACSPGPGYDTSTALFQPYIESATPSHASLLLHYISNKLVRWDAIYFSKISSRGYLFEQEWAFGWGFTRLIALFTQSRITHMIQ
jgi:phosphatidylinositol glycan class V